MVAETKQSVQSENYALHGTPPYHGPFTQGSSCYWLLQVCISQPPSPSRDQGLGSLGSTTYSLL